MSPLKISHRNGSLMKEIHSLGIEIEYMIVDRDSLDPLSISDKVLFDLAGEYTNEFEYEDFAWSNELCLHVLELKTLEPCESIAGCIRSFQPALSAMNAHLEKYNAMLLAGSAHPFMDPTREAHLWPHGYKEIYTLYNKIFDCRGHGWVNLQATHLNIGFSNEQEFAALHSAIRFILPIIPALSASSPVLAGKITGYCDTRLHYYAKNQKIVPEIAGEIIPEQAYTYAAYDTMILQPMFTAIAQHDTRGILAHEWLNSRGVIARFDRNAFEIRILDVQESLRAESAVLEIVLALIQSVMVGEWPSSVDIFTFKEKQLASFFFDIVKSGRSAIINDQSYCEAFGIKTETCSAGTLWQHIINRLLEKGRLNEDTTRFLDIYHQEGCLSERIMSSLPVEPTISEIRSVYVKLAECLKADTFYRCKK
jgi:glutamate---cysteine ligase / carboxylate-amine ligase